MDVIERLTELPTISQGTLLGSQELFRALIEQSPVSTQILARDGSTIMVNKAWEKLWRSTPDQLEGWNILKDEQLKAQGMLPLVRKAFAGEAVKFPSVYYDPALIKRRGRPRWIDGSMYPIKDAQGVVREVVLVHQDVTDQRRAEAEVETKTQNLQESRDQLEFIFSGISEGVTVHDTSGRIIYANQSAAQMLGQRSVAALKKSSPKEALDQFELWDESNNRLRPANLPSRRAMRGETPPDLVIRYRRVGSEEDRWSAVSARPIKDADGRVVSVINIMRDITMERRAQEMLALHMTMQDGIMVSGVNGVVTFMNPQALTLLGLKRSLEGVPEGAAAKEPGKYLKYEIEPLFDVSKARRQVFRGEEGRGIVRVRSKPVRLVELSFSPFRDGQGKITGAVTTLRDVTELVTKKEQLEVIQQSMRDGVILFGATGVIIYANPAAEEIFGFKTNPIGVRREDFLRSGVLKYAYEPAKGSDAAFTRCLREGTVTLTTGTIRMPSGGERYLDVVFAPMRDQADKIVGVLATYRDMTRIVEKEHQTQTYLSDLEILFESSNLFSSTLNTHEIFRLIIRQVRKLIPDLLECYIGVIKDEDLMLRSYYGLSKPSIRLMGIHEGLEGCVIRRGQHRIVKDAVKDPLVVAIKGRTGKPGALLCLPLKLGSEVLGTITIGVDSADVFSDELLKALLILTSRAATAVDHAATYEQALKERGRWEAVVHHSGEGIATINRSGQVLYWNPALERITGYQASEVLGRRLQEVFSEEELGKVMRGLERENEFEIPITTRSGEERWVSVTASVVREDWSPEQAVRNIIVMVRDITRLKEIETKKSEFVSIASHELRTPLTAIKGYLSMLLGEDAGELSEQQLKFLDRIYRSTDRLVNLVEDLLSVSRIEENRLTTRPRAVDLGEVLEGLWHELDYRAAEKEVQISLNPSTLPPVMADPGHLRQILFNLIDNAIKYTPNKGVVSLSFQKKKGNLIVHVTDTGVGIPEDQMAKLFEKFERVNNPLSVRAGGSGLGLFITKNLIERQGGNIWVRSIPKQGSTFSFSLPIYQEDLRLFKL